MITKREILNAISDLNHDFLTLSFRISDLENEIKLLKKPTAKEGKPAARRGRPPKSVKK